ncbi:hypothetical protein [Synechococcus sp. M16CYN]|uniref:hypothetical protein n=1 Tax=Synechococcus sp. M16CYN TaxID=3103139 RepID=UPI00324A50B1
MQSPDKTERFMDAAKRRAYEVINETNPKLTSLEKGYWLALRHRYGKEGCVN